MPKKTVATLLLLVTVLMMTGMPQCGPAQGPKPSPATPDVTANTVPPQKPAARELTAVDLDSFLDGLVPMQIQRENIAGAVVAVGLAKSCPVVLEQSRRNHRAGLCQPHLVHFQLAHAGSEFELLR